MTALRSLIHHRDFRRLFTGNSISLLGSSVTTVALPLTAVVYLRASPAQLGFLGAAALLPHLVLGLPAGVWVDRLPYRKVLVLADLARAVLLALIPALALLGWLQVWHLYGVAIAAGIGALFESVAAQSFIPSLVPRAQLLPANSVIMLSNATVATTGSALGGLIVSLVTAPVAIAVDAVSFLVAGLCKAGISTQGTTASTRRHMGKEVLEGLRVVFAHPIIRVVTIAAAFGALAGQLQSVVTMLYLVRDLNLSPGLIGLVIATAGAAGILGAVLATPVTRRLGAGRTFIVGMFLTSVAGLVLACANFPGLLVLAFTAQVLYGAGPSLFGVNQQTFRQTLIAPELLSRVNATWRFLIYGMQPIGALLGGFLGSALGLRTTLIIGSGVMLLGTTIALASPLRRLI